MAKIAEIEAWVLVDEAGDYVCWHDEGVIHERYEEEVRPIAEAGGMRRVKVTIRVPLPEPIEIAVDVPDTEGEPTATVG